MNTSRNREVANEALQVTPNLLAQVGFPLAYLSLSV
jgi:hypothetical protein